MFDTIKFDTEIGTARDNQVSPLHDWYRFTAGFSFKLVDEIIKAEKLKKGKTIYESFAGCGTTLVTAQKHGINAVGNEGQELLYDVIRAKLNWNIDPKIINKFLNKLAIHIAENNRKRSLVVHDLLKTLYKFSDLKQLVLIKDFLESSKIKEEEYLFLKLALTQVLHKCCIHPISVPYISRNKVLNVEKSAHEIFVFLVHKMLSDLSTFRDLEKTTEIYLQDSRCKNENIEDASCSVCITSPPYLNNLDYGEISKVCSHFFGLTDSWNDITQKVRKKLVTGSTTHYAESEFSLEQWKSREFYQSNDKLGESLINKAQEIQSVGDLRKGKKSFGILTLYYFEDMFKVLSEMSRVLDKGTNAYLVLGDSAPYGVYINTTEILGQISFAAGFDKYRIMKLRDRGSKWKGLTHRHSLKLSENILLLNRC